jgi:hypothetical protein
MTDPDSLGTTYEEYVATLKDGNLDIDYSDFRMSFLASEKHRAKGGSDYHDLKEDMWKAIKKSRHQRLIKICQQMLECDYTSMDAHKYLHQAAGIIGDTTLDKRHHDIEFGLLRSIVDTGDGQSCESSWIVTQLEEEYFILRMIGADFQGQSLVNFCDEMTVKVDGVERVYFFDAYYVIQARKNN